ncbi:MAG: glutaredoxin family protein [Methylococcales bacterium]|nr:glutaredoxin family protein [Methylococcales bacterium]MDD5631781.1 glutaredoxin family protein [Methylococcales bacterium]
MIRLLLFGTSGCHLCEQAELIIKSWANNKELTIETIDIAGQEQWQEQYAIRIPVLYHPDTQKDLGWPFNHAQVKEFINELIDG